MALEAGDRRWRIAAPAPNAMSGKICRWLSALAIAFVLLCTVIAVAESVSSIGFLYEKNYNEGWNVYNAERLMRHETIYDANYWRVNNYPIISFAVVAALSELTHDPLRSGRGIALVSFVAIGLLAALVTRRLGGARGDAIFAGACALSFYHLTAPAWVAVDDPQSLAEALMLAGLFVYVGGALTARRLAGAAILVVVAGFTKHSLLAIPLAIGLDLAWRAPRRLAFWLAACVGSAVTLLAATQLLAGGTFIEHLLSPRTYIWYNARYHFMKFLRSFKVPLLLVVLSAGVLFGRERLVLAAYGLIAVIAGSLLSGYDGTSYNMLQDAAIFLAIAGGLLLGTLRRSLRSHRLGALAPVQALAALAPLIIAAPTVTAALKQVDQLYPPSRLVAASRAAEQSFTEDVAYLAAHPGAKICESLLLCHEAGAPFLIDPFNSRQYILAGVLDERELLARVASREFAVIEVRAEICDDLAAPSCHILHYPRKFNRFTDAFLYAVDRYYRIDRRSPLGVFYVPR